MPDPRYAIKPNSNFEMLNQLLWLLINFGIVNTEIIEILDRTLTDLHPNLAKKHAHFTKKLEMDFLNEHIFPGNTNNGHPISYATLFSLTENSKEEQELYIQDFRNFIKYYLGSETFDLDKAVEEIRGQRDPRGYKGNVHSNKDLLVKI
ncbi:hypothetical protein [Polynucleobacter sinensis]|uniref:hypothetical protein n=1 Tax=Polynucleobacter sinensis TaxID=1743157 RepID=UPI0007847501|nr:hypothetical protein [Polynucleobacter sinensis]